MSLETAIQNLADAINRLADAKGNPAAVVQAAATASTKPPKPPKDPAATAPAAATPPTPPAAAGNASSAGANATVAPAQPTTSAPSPASASVPTPSNDAAALRAQAKALVMKLAAVTNRDTAVAVIGSVQAGAESVTALRDENLQAFIAAVTQRLAAGALT